MELILRLLFSSQWSINGLHVPRTIFTGEEILVVRQVFGMGSQVRE